MPVDRVIGTIATAQEGNVAYDQLREAGIGRGAIQDWLHRGRLVARYQGIYALAHTALPKYSNEMAAVLACRPRSLISHHTAAYMWVLRPKPADGTIDVTVVDRQARHRPGIRIHRTTWLAKADLRRINNIPITSPARTILEIAPDLDNRGLELALHEAIALKRTTIREVQAVLKRYPHRRGSARLAELADPSRSLTVADSGGAERLHYHLRRSGLPQPLVDAPIDRWRPDFYWPDAQLAVELDGGDFHSTQPRIERDHRKDVELRTKGIEVLRFTGRQIRRDLEFVLVAIAREYERRLLASKQQAA